ncbi:hypothetical protein ADL03_15800 [Nocardia sp. NRRL S-836]|nr:hypothetical protein ADL03_15800 [Nocardia sp. NRRL S-836]
MLLARRERRFYLLLMIEVGRRSSAQGVTAREAELFTCQLPETEQRGRVVPSLGTMHGTEHNGHAPWSLDDHPNATGELLVHSARINPRWETIAQLVQPGDIISLQFTGNTQPHLLNHGQVRDEVELLICREEHTLTILIEATVGASNLARTVRYDGYPHGINPHTGRIRTPAPDCRCLP